MQRFLLTVDGNYYIRVDVVTADSTLVAIPYHSVELTRYWKLAFGYYTFQQKLMLV